MTKPLYFWNGSSFELVGPTTPQSPFAYQTSAPTAPATGDIWIDSDGDVDTYNRQLTRYYFVASAGQTSVSGTDANGLTLAYVAGSEAVYVNGALQVRGVDYTATNGTSITGLSALGLNDVVEVFAYTAFTVANAYTKSETDSLVSIAPGLKLITPSSVTVGSGTATVSTNGGVAFSGCSSISLNNVFSSTYRNYRIMFDVTGPANLDIRMRTSAGDISTTIYNRQYLYASNTTVAGGRDNSATYWGIGGSSTSRNGNVIDLFNVNNSSEILTGLHTMGYRTGSTSNEITFNALGINTTGNLFTGFSIICGSGTGTGEVTVYGYKD